METFVDGILNESTIVTLFIELHTGTRYSCDFNSFHVEEDQVNCLVAHAS